MTTQSQTWRPKPRRRSRLLARIDASPLLAVFIVLVILMMSPVLLYLDLPRFGGVDLPVALHVTPQPGALREDAIQLSVARTGEIFVSGNYNDHLTHVARSGTPAVLRAMLLPGVERRVYVRADARAKYGDVELALVAIRNAGVSDVTFIAYSRKDVDRWESSGRR